jgi:hypothetical protein
MSRRLAKTSSTGAPCSSTTILKWNRAVSAIEVHYQMVQADVIAEHSIRYSMRMKSARRRGRRVKRLRQALETVRRIKPRPGERPKVQGARGRS